MTTPVAAQDIFVQQYIQNSLESVASLDEEPSYDSMTPEQWAKEFEEWVDRHDYITATPITDEAIGRQKESFSRCCYLSLENCIQDDGW